MYNLKELKKAVDQIAEEKGLDAAKVLEAMENSIANAYKKEYCEKGEMVRAKFNLKTGDLKFWKVMTVVDETTVRIVEEDEESPDAEKKFEKRDDAIADFGTSETVLPRYNSSRHIFLEEAKRQAGRESRG